MLRRLNAAASLAAAVAAAIVFAVAAAEAPAVGFDRPTADERSDAPLAPARSNGDRAIESRLAGIDGLKIVAELESPVPGARLFSLTYDQPADHDDRRGERFDQRLTLLHRNRRAPTVLATTGYSLFPGYVSTELGEALGANVLFVEQRFFAESIPASRDWTLLNIRQAASDHHRIVRAFRDVYRGRWLSEGISKGGMTSVYHRFFYPRDVDATVPYSAPISYSPADPVTIGFIDTRGTPECRARIDQFQRTLLLRRDAVEALLAQRAQEAGLTYELFGLPAAYEIAVIDVAFVFWQYYDASLCDAIPPDTASDEALADFFNDITDFIGFYDDAAMTFFGPYYYQAATELGGPAPREAHLLDLLRYPGLNQATKMPPLGVPKPFTEGLMRTIEGWVRFAGRRLVFLYGENDPWAARMYQVTARNDSYRFVVDEGNHNSMIGDLPESEQEVIENALERWLRLPFELDIPSTPPPAALGHEQQAEQRRQLIGGVRP
jgi:hypothetical protein